MTRRSKDNDVMLVQPGQVYWFVPGKSSSSAEPVAFVRDNRGGAVVLGAGSGPDYTRHGESWWDKLCEIGRFYIPVDLAMDYSRLPAGWSPPALSEKDASVLMRIQKGEI